MDFNIIGAGRLGTSLASALIHFGQSQLLAICNRSFESAQHQVRRLQQGQAVKTITNLPHASVTFITSADDELFPIIEELICNPNLKQGDLIVHCSGVYSSAILHPLQKLGYRVASLHPLRSFPSREPNPNAFENCDCAVEGEQTEINFLSQLFGQLGAKVVSLNAEKKQLYHAAATMASNYLITLASTATSLFVEAGIEPKQAKLMCERLMESSLRNIKGSACIEQALTGPLMRGDIQTLFLHLNAINCPQIEGLYRAAGLSTLPLTQHDDERLATLKALLTKQVTLIH